MRYVFRLTKALKDKLDLAVPPKSHGRSSFIRDAIGNFLTKPKQPLVDRPHLRGRPNTYHDICAILPPDQIQGIKAAYPEVSISIVIQASVASELRKAKYKVTTTKKAETKSAGHHEPNQFAVSHSGKHRNKRTLEAFSEQS